jgi:hypothetical protein
MTFGEFRDDLVIPYAKQRGVSFVDTSDTPKLNKVLKLAIEEFSRWTYAFYEPGQSLSIMSGTDIYSIHPIFEPKEVFVKGSRLRKQGSVVRFSKLHPSPQSGTPTEWFKFPGDKIKLFPVPDTNISGTDTFVEGYRVHQAIADDDTVLEFPDRAVFLLSGWCAIYLSKPVQTGTSAFQQLMIRDKILADELRRYRAENLSFSLSYPKDFRQVYTV